MLFRSPQYLHLLWLLIPLVLLLRIWIARRARDLQAFLGERGAEQVRRDRRRQWLSATLTLLTCLFIILALARPQWGKVQEPHTGRGVDIIFAVDTSLSMLAEDVRPSRLERAKRDLAELLERLDGNRFGLIAFAEASAILAPLTLDTSAVRIFVDDLSTDVVDERGTWLARAMTRAVRDYPSKTGAPRVLVLLSDGEDQHNDALSAAREAADAGLVILAVGLGSTEGANIYTSGESGARELKRDSDGRPVVTRLNEQLLAEVAKAAGGRYWRAQVDGSEVEGVARFIDAIEKGELKTSGAIERQERYQIPLAIAVALLGVNLTLSLRRFAAK